VWSTWTSAFLMGLFGGTHCVAMCGGVVGLLCAGLSSQTSSRAETLRFTAAYNAGRVASYALLGALLAATAGSVQSIAPALMHPWKVALRVVAAVATIAAGVYLSGWIRLPRSTLSEWFASRFSAAVRPIVRRFVPVRSASQAALVGGLWGLMPCGLLYSAMVLAFSTRSAWHGAATMAAFGAGTLPLLVGLGLFGGAVRRFSSVRRVRSMFGLALVSMGLWSGYLIWSQHRAVTSREPHGDSRSEPTVPHHCH
jgi:sulfite exporter TauE/SafE